MSSQNRRGNVPLEQAREYVEAWKSSGLSQEVFSLKIGYSQSSICRWQDRIKKHDLKSLENKTSMSPPRLKPIEITKPILESQHNIVSKQQVEILVSDSLRLRIPSIVDTKQIAELLRELQSCN